MANALVSKAVFASIEPAVRTLANRIFILTGSRPGSQRRKPTMSTFFETGIVLAVYEFLLMAPDLAHLEIRRENSYAATTKPEQVDLWIRPPNGGRPHLVEAGDFSAAKLKTDLAKMRRLNKKGINWFLGFFREEPHSQDPWARLTEMRKKKGSLKGLHIDLDERLVHTFAIKLPKQSDVHFGFALVRVK
jgi:hypothetical protein